MAREWAVGMVHPSRHGTPLFEAIVAMLARKTPEHYAAQIEALLNRPDAEPLLATIRCPTLLLCGRDDAWSPPRGTSTCSSRSQARAWSSSSSAAT